jgi:hypothetical protein
LSSRSRLHSHTQRVKLPYPAGHGNTHIPSESKLPYPAGHGYTHISSGSKLPYPAGHGYTHIPSGSKLPYPAGHGYIHIPSGSKLPYPAGQGYIIIPSGSRLHSTPSRSKLYRHIQTIKVTRQGCTTIPRRSSNTSMSNRRRLGFLAQQDYTPSRSS